jgi:hypothetical protein
MTFLDRFLGPVRRGCAEVAKVADGFRHTSLALLGHLSNNPSQATSHHHPITGTGLTNGTACSDESVVQTPAGFVDMNTLIGAASGKPGPLSSVHSRRLPAAPFKDDGPTTRELSQVCSAWRDKVVR